jgi:hypothetical protein
MKLSELVKNLYSKTGDYGDVVAVSTHHGSQIIQNSNNQYYLDGTLLESKLDNLEEVKRYIELNKSASETKKKIYETISENTIAKIIKKHNEDIKVTTNLVESYMSLASSKVFTIDPVLLEMRSSYKTAHIIENKLDFKLDDGKVIAISEETVEKIGNILNTSNDKEEILSYMRQSVENFASVVKQL